MMTREAFLLALADRFEGWELVEFLQISVEDILEQFDEEVFEAKEDLEEFMNVGE